MTEQTCQTLRTLITLREDTYINKQCITTYQPPGFRSAALSSIAMRKAWLNPPPYRTKTISSAMSQFIICLYIAYNRLKENPQYSEVCTQQAKSEEMVEELYQQLEKADRIAIRRHYEGEVNKTNFEIKEVYLQGLCDCFKLLAFLSGQSEAKL